MRRVFVDTSAFYALADADDPAHGRAVEFLGANHETPLVTTNLVFAETMSLISKRLGKAVAIRYGEAVRESQVFDIVTLPEEYREPAWELFRSQRDQAWDLIDCSSLVVMERFKIRQAFTFDRHFQQQGFEVVPG